MNNPVYFIDPDGMSSSANESNDFDHLGRARHDRYGMFIPMGERGPDNATAADLREFFEIVNLGRQGGGNEESVSSENTSSVEVGPLENSTSDLDLNDSDNSNFTLKGTAAQEFVRGLQIQLSFNDLQKYYLGDGYTSAQVYEIIGGRVYDNYRRNPNAYANSCALRLSYALNRSGIKIPYIEGQTGSGRDKKKWYFYRVSDLSNFFTNLFGKPDINGKSRATFAGKTGIILFDVSEWSDASGHFTIWDGTKVGHGDYFKEADNVHLWIFNKKI